MTIGLRTDHNTGIGETVEEEEEEKKEQITRYEMFPDIYIFTGLLHFWALN